MLNIGKFVGVGPNKRIAKCTAAKRALRALKVIEDIEHRKQEEKLMEQNYLDMKVRQQMLNEWKENFDKLNDHYR